MVTRDDDRFQPRPGAPKARTGPRSQRFISQVLKASSKSGATGSGSRPASTFGRGRVASVRAGQGLAPNARRAIIKARYVVLKRAGAKAVATHLRYIERDGTTRDGKRGQAYGADTDAADLQAFEQRGRSDRHQFRFIVSVEDSPELEDLKGFTRQLMQRVQTDLETGLDWVAVDHWDTDNPHTHIVLRGRAEDGQNLVIAPDYMAHGMRMRASELATEWLGTRTELEMRQSLQREVDQERWTGLDRSLQREAVDGLVLPAKLATPWLQRLRPMLIGRLLCLQRMGLATEHQPGTWAIHAKAEPTLRAMGERGDIIRAMQRAMNGKQRELAVFQPGDESRTIVGRVVGKGLADELHDKGYLIVDSTDGKAHYVALPPRSEIEQYPTGAVVEVKGSTGVRAADRNIAALSVDGIYRTDHHLALTQGQAMPDRDPREVVAAHVRRLEALRRAGIVEQKKEGVWHVPDDLVERGRQYDAQRLGGGVALELKSHLPIERQTRVIGATWLDQQLIGYGKGLGDLGFGSEVKDALQQRADFLAEQGLAERRGQRLILARNLLATLRGRELAKAAQDITAETGLEHRPVADGQRVAGIYRRSIMLASGCYAMLDDGVGFSLVPWKPVIEQRPGQKITVTLHGNESSWKMGWRRGSSIS